MTASCILSPTEIHDIDSFINHFEKNLTVKTSGIRNMPTVFRSEKFGGEFGATRKTILVKLHVNEEEYEAFIHHEIAERNTTERMKAERQMYSRHKKPYKADVKDKRTSLLESMKNAVKNKFVDETTGEIVTKKKKRPSRRSRRRKKAEAKKRISGWIVGMPKPVAVA